MRQSSESNADVNVLRFYARMDYPIWRKLIDNDRSATFELSLQLKRTLNNNFFQFSKFNETVWNLLFRGWSVDGTIYI